MFAKRDRAGSADELIYRKGNFVSVQAIRTLKRSSVQDQFNIVLLANAAFSVF